jgi:F0F1-type ATP synthase membrane subunit b/b'
MPHLDLCTFIVQYNWTILTFLSLYMIISINSLPEIGKILHLRTRKIKHGIQNQFNKSSQSKNSNQSVLKNSLTI